MNILTAPLPASVMVGGKFYEINTDFRVWIEIENTFLDNKLSIYEKIAKMLKLCYKTLPPSIEDALFGMMSFYLCKTEEKKEKQVKKSSKSVKRIYSFKQDAMYIYSAFFSQYNIDLTTAKLHWWQFMALFKGLSDDSKFCEIMRWRAINIEDIKNKTQKSFVRKMKHLYALCDNRSETEIETDMIDALEHLF